MERIDEKLDWNEVKKFGKGIVIGTLLGLIITPNQLRDSVYREFVINRITTHLNGLTEYKKDNELITAIESVIRKVENSNYITNKEEVINRISKIVYKEFESSYFLHPAGGVDLDDNLMSYYYDNVNDIDYIMVNMDQQQDHKLLSYIHELNHFVDKHSKVNKKIIPTDLLIDVSNMSRSKVRDIYIKYFNTWGKINIGDNSYNTGIVFYYSIFGAGDKYGKPLKSKEKYYVSDDEIFARISVMKSFMLKEGIIKSIDEKITKHHIELIRRYVLKFEDDSSKYLDILQLGFLEYLPLIDWSKVDDLNLIAQNKGEGNIDLV